MFISTSKAGRDLFGVRNAPPRSLQLYQLGLLSTMRERHVSLSGMCSAWSTAVLEHPGERQPLVSAARGIGQPTAQQRRDI